MSLKRFFLFSGIAAACFASLLIIDRLQPRLLLRLRNLERDAIVQAGRTAPANPDLVFMAIDSDSVTLDAKTDVRELYGLTSNDSIEAWPESNEQNLALAARSLCPGLAAAGRGRRPGRRFRSHLPH